MEFLLGAIVLYLLVSSGILSKGIAGIPGSSSVSGGTAAPPSTIENPTAVNAGLNSGFATTQAEINAATGTAATKSLSTISTALGASSQIASAIPIVGAAFAAVASILIAASKKRAQEATSENQAVDAALPAWDAAIQQVATLFNNGGITATQVGLLLGTPRTMQYFNVPVGQCWNNFWQEVGPQVQSGRNGCNSGKVTQGKTSFCGGTTYGAGCCVAYDDMDNSMGNPNLPNLCFFGALAKAIAQPGTPFTATILSISSSKYSSYSRGSYTVTLEAPTAIN